MRRGAGSGRRWSALRAVWVATGALALANCAGPQALKGNGSETKYGVKSSPRVVADGEPVPKGGGRNMVGKPYVVAGRTYVPSTTGYRKEGWASWYGTAFHGRLTANGEVFDRESVAAAHPTMPLPSYVRVTNMLNKRSMIVRVNDRGPYEQNRILDVSERVAEALDFRRRGTARVAIEYVGRASLRGSDDEKLLATLTTDGKPAPFGAARTMLADLRDDPAPRSPVTAEPAAEPAVPRRSAPVLAAAAPIEEPIDAALSATAVDGDDAGPAAADHPMPPRRPVPALRVASAADTSPDTADEVAVRGPAPVAPRFEPLPPQRPHFAGIY